MYFIAFAGILAGLITYNIRPPPAAPPRSKNKKKKIPTKNPKEWTESEFKPDPQSNGNTIYFFRKGKNGINSGGGPVINGQLNYPFSNGSLINSSTPLVENRADSLSVCTDI